MKVRILKPARITVPAGEIVEVSPAEANFLMSVGAAEIVSVKETREKRKK